MPVPASDVIHQKLILSLRMLQSVISEKELQIVQVTGSIQSLRGNHVQ